NGQEIRKFCGPSFRRAESNISAITKGGKEMKKIFGIAAISLVFGLIAGCSDASSIIEKGDSIIIAARKNSQAAMRLGATIGELCAIQEYANPANNNKTLEEIRKDLEICIEKELKENEIK
ncbi:MAG: hypothetical protein WA635_10685, partial [Gallionella sp.]